MNLDELLGLVYRVLPVVVLGIYLGKIEGRIEAIKDRLDKMDS